MAGNFVKSGNRLSVTAAPYARNSGQGMLVGSIFAVALAPVASGAAVEADVVGIFNLDKATSQAWTQGAKIYWDNTAKNCTTTSTSNTLIGVAAEAAASGDTSGKVRLGLVA